MASFPVRPEDVVAARDLLRGTISETPLRHSRVLSERLGGPVYFKCENLQRTGSFKSRGGYVRIARLPEEDRARGVVAASAGNHAQGEPGGPGGAAGKLVLTTMVRAALSCRA